MHESKDSLEISVQKTRRMFMSRHQNAGQIINKTANKSSENMAAVKYLGTILSKQIYIR
jgi:hypothetical protein